MWAEIRRASRRTITKLSNTSIKRNPSVISDKLSSSCCHSVCDACQHVDRNAANGSADALSCYDYTFSNLVSFCGKPERPTDVEQSTCQRIFTKL